MKKLFLVLLLATTVAQAETYRWTDSEGTVHFSESLGEVPTHYRNSAKPLGMELNDTTKKSKGVSTAEPRQSANDNGSVAPDVDELKERMLKDEGIMALISAMQNDPKMQSLLNDPALLRAIQAMDINALLNNPDFMKLLNNPRVQEIEKRLQHGKP
jgi:hypothetical protein